MLPGISVTVTFNDGYEGVACHFTYGTDNTYTHFPESVVCDSFLTGNQIQCNIATADVDPDVRHYFYNLECVVTVDGSRVNISQQGRFEAGM